MYKYLKGECIAVWRSMIQREKEIGERITCKREVEDVVRETMLRVKYNVTMISWKLHHYFEQLEKQDQPPLDEGDKEDHKEDDKEENVIPIIEEYEGCDCVDRFERFAGIIPLSIKAFWKYCGSIHLERNYWTSQSIMWDDGLEVRDCCSEQEHLWEEYESDEGIIDWACFLVMAPSRSGTEHMGGYFVIPHDFHVDAVLLGIGFYEEELTEDEREMFNLKATQLNSGSRIESFEIGFVDYLRFSILKRGGFPGLSPPTLQRDSEVFDGNTSNYLSLWESELWHICTDDLIPF